MPLGPAISKTNHHQIPPPSVFQESSLYWKFPVSGGWVLTRGHGWRGSGPILQIGKLRPEENQQGCRWKGNLTQSQNTPARLTHTL